ncbi:MAG: 16S rRNA (cytosine(1402)-N(4))-methyltransferase RsmH [Planctomycetes bacterium]|nr:16S rRNA (cytosine(1402)-N(4))-methyltransferase RsmH [Planctomycetota bacterium]
MSDSPSESANPKPPRRKRYQGTHPKRFEEKYKELAPDKYPDEVAKVRAAGRTPAGTHVPVMLREVLAALKPQPGEVVLDCTLGYGGHTAALAKTGARVIATDLDAAELARTTERLKSAGLSVSTHHTNFAGIGNVLAAEGLAGVDCLLADLGISSMQLDDPQRGFGFKRDAPLDMRMDATRGITAAQLIAETDEEALAGLLRELGDEPRAEAIAAAIKQGCPTRTGELVNIVLRAYGLKSYKKRSARDQHPAARVFQALRMAVNRETANLDHLLRTLPYLLNAGGRVAFITFHSGEEKRVHDALLEGFKQGLYTAIEIDGVRPSSDEIYNNPRARSAKLLIATKA